MRTVRGAALRTISGILPGPVRDSMVSGLCGDLKRELEETVTDGFLESLLWGMEVAFALDRAQGKLYLDLNRNLDLTDDPGGVYSCQPRFSFGSSIGFSNVRLTFNTVMGLHPALLDLWFIYLGKTNQPNVVAARRYFWEGRLAFEGRDWQVGLVDSLQGRIGAADGAVLLLRPWSARNQVQPA